MSPEPRVVAAAEADKPVIARLIQLYLHDMTEHLPFAIGPDGLYPYDVLERFWQHPYLIFAGDELAGFALVIADCPVTGLSPCWFMAEFFVLRGHRGNRLGRSAFAEILLRHKGPWHIGVIEKNTPAMAFWNKIVNRDVRIGSHYFDGESWVVYAFES